MSEDPSQQQRTPDEARDAAHSAVRESIRAIYADMDKATMPGRSKPFQAGFRAGMERAIAVLRETFPEAVGGYVCGGTYALPPEEEGLMP